jgi:hypothetical protein
MASGPPPFDTARIATARAVATGQLDFNSNCVLVIKLIEGVTPSVTILVGNLPVVRIAGVWRRILTAVG